MDNIKLEDTLNRKIEEEIKNRNDLISELRKILISVENKKIPKVLNEIETSNTRLDSYVKLLTGGETRKQPVKKVAISAKPISRSSLEIDKVPKTPR